MNFLFYTCIVFAQATNTFVTSFFIVLRVTDDVVSKPQRPGRCLFLSLSPVSPPHVGAVQQFGTSDHQPMLRKTNIKLFGQQMVPKQGRCVNMHTHTHIGKRSMHSAIFVSCCTEQRWYQLVGVFIFNFAPAKLYVYVCFVATRFSSKIGLVFICCRQPTQLHTIARYLVS